MGWGLQRSAGGVCECVAKWCLDASWHVWVCSCWLVKDVRIVVLSSTLFQETFKQLAHFYIVKVSYISAFIKPLLVLCVSYLVSTAFLFVCLIGRHVFINEIEKDCLKFHFTHVPPCNLPQPVCGCMCVQMSA